MRLYPNGDEVYNASAVFEAVGVAGEVRERRRGARARPVPPGSPDAEPQPDGPGDVAQGRLC